MLKYPRFFCLFVWVPRNPLKKKHAGKDTHWKLLTLFCTPQYNIKTLWKNMNIHLSNTKGFDPKKCYPKTEKMSLRTKGFKNWKNKDRRTYILPGWKYEHLYLKAHTTASYSTALETTNIILMNFHTFSNTQKKTSYPSSLPGNKTSARKTK